MTAPRTSENGPLTVDDWLQAGYESWPRRGSTRSRSIAFAPASARFGQHPWQHAFDAAVDRAELGEFSPWWIYPGKARVERLVVHLPLSRADAQYERLRDSLTLYRMMLGQPRQEDMMELLRQRGVTDSEVTQLDEGPPPRR